MSKKANKNLGKKANKVQAKEFKEDIPVIKIKSSFKMETFEETFKIKDSSNNELSITISTDEEKIRSVLFNREKSSKQLLKLIKNNEKEGANSEYKYKLKVNYISYAFTLCDEKTIEKIDKLPIAAAYDIAKIIFNKCDNFLYIQ